MHANKIWLAFLAAITLAVVVFSWDALQQMRRYYFLQQKTSLTSTEWGLVKINEESYRVGVEFSFVHQGKTYRGLEHFQKPLYPNPWAAAHGMKERETETQEVWFYPNNPKISSLEKKFPLKELLSAVVLLGLWLYFVQLGFSMRSVST